MSVNNLFSTFGAPAQGVQAEFGQLGLDKFTAAGDDPEPTDTFFCIDPGADGATISFDDELRGDTKTGFVLAPYQKIYGRFSNVTFSEGDAICYYGQFQFNQGNP
jgi:hypothetical protein